MLITGRATDNGVSSEFGFLGLQGDAEQAAFLALFKLTLLTSSLSFLW